MPTIDFSSGYRDATKGATLKALQKRQDEQAAVTALAMRPREIGSMWQGAAQIGDVISGSIREGRLANQEAAGRARFAELLAGGLAPDEIGEAMGLDPETTMKWQERNWAQDDMLKQRGWSVEDAERRIQAEKDAQAAGFAHADTSREDTQTFTAGQQDDQQAAAADLAEKADKAQRVLQDARATDEQKQEAQRVIDEAAAAEKLVTTGRETERIKQQSEVTEIGTKTEARTKEWLKLNPGGDIKSPEAQAYILRDSAEPTGGFLGPQGVKAVQEFKEQANVITTGLNDINEAKALVPLALTGDIGKKVAEWASSLGEGGIQAAVAASNSGMADMLPDFLKELKGITREQIQATVRMYQIMDNVATMRMSGTLKGQTSNLELDKFTKIFANPGATPEAKLQALISLEQAFTMDRDAISVTLQGTNGEGLPKYKYVPVTGGMTPAEDAAAPAAAGGGDTEEPKEGDVFSAPGKPDVIYKNGKYVNKETGEVVQ